MVTVMIHGDHYHYGADNVEDLKKARALLEAGPMTFREGIIRLQEAGLDVMIVARKEELEQEIDMSEVTNVGPFPTKES